MTTSAGLRSRPLLAAAVGVLGVFGAFGAAAIWMRRNLVVVTVRGPSMRPTLRDGDRVLVRRRPVSAVRPGELVVFQEQVQVSDELLLEARSATAADRRQFGVPDHWVIKRATAVPGSRVPKRDVEPLADVDHDVVPPGRFVVLGDNPAASVDSRSYGYVDGEHLLGVVVRRLPPTTTRR